MERALNIADKFKAEGYELLTEYVNNKTKVVVKCPSGNSWGVRPDRFFNKTKARCTCVECKKKRGRKTRTNRTAEQLIELVNERGYIALEIPKRVRDYILVECRSCGYTVSKNVQSIIDNNIGCANCNGNARLTTEVFSEHIAEHAVGYSLLSEVRGAFKKASIMCDMGHTYDVNPVDFINKGYRCPTCKFIKIRGEGHWNYNANLTQEERETMRSFPGYTRWQIEVKERDTFTCQCCGDNRGGNLVSHHIESWNIAKEKRLDVDNGTTLCECCHRDFHGKYGYGNNTENQYREWLASTENGRRFIYA